MGIGEPQVSELGEREVHSLPYGRVSREKKKVVRRAVYEQSTSGGMDVAFTGLILWLVVVWGEEGSYWAFY